MNPSIANNQRFRRQVIFDKNCQVAIIQSAKRNPPDTTTYQIVEKNAVFRLTSSFFTPGENPTPLSVEAAKQIIEKMNPADLEKPYSSYADKSTVTNWYKGLTIKIDYEGLSAGAKKMDGFLLSKILYNIPSAVKDYLFLLNERNRQFNLMPAGFGWDGVITNIELMRVSKVKQLLIGDYEWSGFGEDFVKKICDLSAFTPSHLVSVNWHKACNFNFNQVVQIGKVTSESEIFILGQTDELSKLIHPEIIRQGDNVSVVLTDEYPRYVIIVTKILTRVDRENYGVKIRLYESDSSKLERESHCG